MEINKHSVLGAVNEIESLRHQNQLMAARLEMFDKMFLLFNTTPAYQSNGAMHPDVVYELRKYIAVAEEKENQKGELVK